MSEKKMHNESLKLNEYFIENMIVIYEVCK